MTTDEYNKKSMEKFGWGRWHLGLSKDASMADVEAAVREFQEENGLVVDGMCGPVTSRRLYTHGEFRRDEGSSAGAGFITSGGSIHSVGFRSLCLSPETSLVGLKGHGYRNVPPTQVVWHWDATFSAEHCRKILRRRKLSTHGCIDNDGKFVQYLDLEDHVGFHAGTRCNAKSIGVDISNAVYPKYAGWYERNATPRKVMKAIVHGREVELLEYYESQIETAIKFVRVGNRKFGIPMKWAQSDTVIDQPHKFAGHIAHFNITRKKWDVAGFPFDRIMKEANDGQA